MRVITSLDKWIVTLVTGETLALWADGFSEVEDEYVFTLLVEMEPDEPGLGSVAIANTTPRNPSRGRDRTRTCTRPHRRGDRIGLTSDRIRLQVLSPR